MRCHYCHSIVHLSRLLHLGVQGGTRPLEIYWLDSTASRCLVHVAVGLLGRLLDLSPPWKSTQNTALKSIEDPTFHPMSSPAIAPRGLALQQGLLLLQRLHLLSEPRSASARRPAPPGEALKGPFRGGEMGAGDRLTRACCHRANWILLFIPA